MTSRRVGRRLGGAQRSSVGGTAGVLRVHCGCTSLRDCTSHLLSHSVRQCFVTSVDGRTLALVRDSGVCT